MNRFYNISGVLSGLVGGSILLVFFFFLHNTIMISLLSGLAGFAGTYTLLYAFKPKDELRFGLGNPVTEEELNRTLKQGYDHIKQLQYYETQVRDPEVKEKLDKITRSVRDIFVIFKKDPKDIKYARQFLSYYLDTTIKIVQKYTALSAQHVNSQQIKSTLLKAENMLDSIAVAFEKQKEKLLSDDVMDLDVEIQTLEKTFNAEDLK
jgi:5-bromo-4-chloroindolyl phosphate hydrolysis protein